MVPSMIDVSQLLPAAIRITHTRNGLMLYPSQDAFIGPCLETYGEYSPDEATLFQKLLKPCDVVLEVGANIGVHTVLLSRLVGPSGQIHAFEPQRSIFQILCGNLALNNRQNVVAKQIGLGDKQETLRISPPGIDAAANFGGVTLKSEGDEAIDVVTVDLLGLTRLDLIKIDVEGMENAVLKGSAETVRRLRPVIYVENDRAETSPSLIRTIFDLGYRIWWHLPGLYKPQNFRGVAKNIFPIYYISINMICLPSDSDRHTELTEGLIEVSHDGDRPIF